MAFESSDRCAAVALCRVGSAARSWHHGRMFSSRKALRANFDAAGGRSWGTFWQFSVCELESDAILDLETH